MIKLALNLPGNSPVNVSTPPNLNPSFTAEPSAGGGFYFLVSQFLIIALYIAGVLLVVWLSWGAFEYLVAGGNKDKLALARKRIVHALVGFTIAILAFSGWQFAQQIIKPNIKTIQQVTPP
jgi:hypothetical protein